MRPAKAVRVPGTPNCHVELTGNDVGQMLFHLLGARQSCGDGALSNLSHGGRLQPVYHGAADPEVGTRLGPTRPAAPEQTMARKKRP